MVVLNRLLSSRDSATSSLLSTKMKISFPDSSFRLVLTVVCFPASSEGIATSAKVVEPTVCGLPSVMRSLLVAASELPILLTVTLSVNGTLGCGVVGLSCRPPLEMVKSGRGMVVAVNVRLPVLLLSSLSVTLF